MKQSTLRQHFFDVVMRDLSADFRVRAFALSGSHAVGLDTPTSDIDYIALVAEHEPAAEPDAEFPDRDYFAEGVTCDLQTVTEAQVTAWTRRLAETQPTLLDYAPIFTVRRIVRNLIRIVMARPWWGDEEFQRIRDLVDLDVLRRRFMTLYAADAMTFVRDTSGLLDVRDLLTAFETSRRALHCGIEIVLAAYHDFNYSGKFAAARLQRHSALGAVAAELVGLLYAPFTADSDERTIAVIRQRIAQTGRLTAAGQIFGWHRKLKGALPVALVGTGGAGRPRRNDQLAVLRVDDGVMIGGAKSIGGTVAGGLVWALADGARTSGELGHRFAQLTGVSLAKASTWVRNEIAVKTAVGAFR